MPCRTNGKCIHPRTCILMNYVSHEDWSVREAHCCLICILKRNIHTEYHENGFISYATLIRHKSNIDTNKKKVLTL